ncbi:DUF2938 family protein [Candidatus Parcubacteria bacterium]|nr:DUF2938 family protein [Candidatus Parcubacteria bacterium]
MDYLLGGSLGALVALLFAIPAIVLEVKRGVGPSDAPLIVDARQIFGRQLKRREAFLVGLLIHILFGFLFGLLYVVFVLRGWLFNTHAPYTLVSLIVYALLSWMVAGLVIYPALGMGLFARREGKDVWIETIVSHLLLGIALWLLVQYFQPPFFIVPT